jgi:transcriptional regulator with XRE-family HTH domain
MTVQQWTTGRKAAKLTQVQAAKALGVSQPYLSQLENGSRVAGVELARKAAAVYRLSAAVLPLPKAADKPTVDPTEMERELGALGYPGFAHASQGEPRNPAGVVYDAVVQKDLDTRLVEALPWVLNAYTDLDWRWLRDHAKLRNVQNRLGYLVELAKGAAGNGRDVHTLSEWVRDLEDARLVREDTLCRESMPQAERRWLKLHRPPAAEHWNLLTSLTVEQLPYAAK